MQHRCIAIHAIRAGGEQLVFTVSAAQQSHTQHARASGRQQVPNGITDDVALCNSHSKFLLSRQEQVGLGLRPRDVATLDDDGLWADAKGFER